jgi:HAD superfamily hydrolase (TIGR01509 family)
MINDQLSPRVAIFDFDGTLYDSSPSWTDIIVSYLRSHGIEPPGYCFQMIKPLGILGGARMIVQRYSIGEDPEAVAAGWRKRIGVRYREDIPLRPGAREYLNFLRKKGATVCLATAMEMEYVQWALERTAAKPLFNAVVTAGELNTDKTSARIFLYCAEKYGARPQDAWVFEDAPAAAKVCHAAGFPVIAVFDGICMEDFEEMKLYADVRISSYAELLAEIKERG